RICRSPSIFGRGSAWSASRSRSARAALSGDDGKRRDESAGGHRVGREPDPTGLAENRHGGRGWRTAPSADLRHDPVIDGLLGFNELLDGYRSPPACTDSQSGAIRVSWLFRFRRRTVYWSPSGAGSAESSILVAKHCYRSFSPRPKLLIGGRGGIFR